MSVKETSLGFIAFLAIISTSLAAGAFLLSWPSSTYFFDSSPKNDGFVPPRNIAKTIDQTQKSTVLVTCSLNKEDGSIGTGWAIDSDLLQVASDKTTVITNYHVIEECLKERGSITVARLYKKE